MSGEIQRACIKLAKAAITEGGLFRRPDTVRLAQELAYYAVRRQASLAYSPIIYSPIEQAQSRKTTSYTRSLLLLLFRDDDDDDVRRESLISLDDEPHYCSVYTTQCTTMYRNKYPNETY